MSKDFNDDALLGYVADLQRAEPTVRASVRIRSRAHAVLKKQQHARSKPALGSLVVNGLFALVSSVYLAGAVGEAIRLIAGLGRATR